MPVDDALVIQKAPTFRRWSCRCELRRGDYFAAPEEKCPRARAARTDPQPTPSARAFLACCRRESSEIQLGFHESRGQARAPPMYATTTSRRAPAGWLAPTARAVVGP